MNVLLEDCGSVSETEDGDIEWRISDFIGKVEEYKLLRSPTFMSWGEEWNVDVDAGELRVGRDFTLYVHKSSRTVLLFHLIIGIRSSNGGTYACGAAKGINQLSSIQLPLCLSTLKKVRSRLVPPDTLTILITLIGRKRVSTDVEQSQPTKTSEVGVQCDVKTQSTQTTERCPADGVPRPTSGIDDLSQNLKGLLENAELSDATVRVREVDFRVHRAILAARTPVFAAMFRHDTSERTSGVVDIKDCEPDIFRKFLEYIYTGKLEELSTQNATGLYQIADKYHIDKLKELCLQRMNSGLSVQTFCHVIRLSLRHDERELTAKATDFFLDYAGEIVQTVEWQNFLVENPTWANELFVKHIKAVKK